MKKKFNIIYQYASKNILIALGLMASVSITGCKKDFLVAEPVLELPSEQAFTSASRVDKVIVGLYSSLKDGTFLGGRYLIYNDVRAEEFLNRTSNVVTGYDVYQGSNDAASIQVNNIWTQGYLVINRCNLAIDGLTKNASGLPAEVINPAIAEAKFIRAVTYLSLVQVFAKAYVLDQGASKGLPLRLQPETDLTNNKLPFSTVKQVYDQILLDLNVAETGLPDTYSTPLARTTRAHKNTAIAYKSRVYLVMGNMAKVREEANKIVPAVAPFVNSTRAPFALQADVANVFVTPYTTSESIFSLPMSTTNAPGTQNQLAFYYNNTGGANREFLLNNNATGTKGIYTDAAWPATDARKVKFTLVSGTSVVFRKFATPAPYLDYVPQIRYAEVLLNLAEAEADVASGGNVVRAQALLQAVRSRSDAGYVYGVLTPAQLTDAILKERRIELLGEGFRYNDLARKGLPIPSVGAGTSIAVGDGRYVFPIPVAEQNNNPQ